MKRVLTLIGVIAACIVCFLSVRGALPFMAVFGISMEPELRAGDIIFLEEVSPSHVKVGDIIVFTIPPLVRDAYNYPAVVAHRVIEVHTERGISFRTKGDNTGEDPFTVRAEDLKGAVSKQIPYLGFPLLFFQSQQGMIFVIVALALFALYLYTDELNKGGRTLHRGIFAPVINEEKRSNRVLARKIDATEQKMNSTEQALEKFAAAIAEYAQHLSSHTSAIQGLSEASQELKKSSAEQNRFLMHMMENMGQMEPGREAIASRVEPVVPEPEEPAPEAEKPVPAEVGKRQFPPGCAKSRQQLTAEEILEKLKKPKYQV
jgi:signal peptidase I